VFVTTVALALETIVGTLLDVDISSIEDDGNFTSITIVSVLQWSHDF